MLPFSQKHRNLVVEAHCTFFVQQLWRVFSASSLGLFWCSMAAILVGLAQAQQGTHQAHLHRWSERSVAAYLEHKEVFRAPRSGHKQQGGESVSYWDQFWPAFVCPWQDRVGRISEGGKWLCNWQVMLDGL
jgi:hypothetical protein